MAGLGDALRSLVRLGRGPSADSPSSSILDLELHKLPQPEQPEQLVELVPTWSKHTPRFPDVNLRNFVDEGYRRNAVVYVCVTEIATSASEPNLQVLRDGEPVEDHELLTLLDYPHPDYSRFAFVEAILTHLMTTGEAYVHKGRTRLGRIVRLTPLRPDCMAPVAGDDGRVDHYEYRLEGDQPQIIAADDIIRVMLPDPLNPMRGLSPIQVCALYGDLDTDAARYLRDFFLNGGIPLGLIKLKNQVKREERDRISAQFSERYGRGSAPNAGTNFHRVGVISGDAEYQELGASPERLRLDSIWDVTESRITAAFGVPALVVQLRVGIRVSSYNNYATARKSFWTETLTPLYERIGNALTMYLAREFGDDLEVRFDLADVAELQEAKDSISTRAREEYAGGLITLNEARKAIGMPEAEVDSIVRPQGCADPKEPIQQPQPAGATGEPPPGAPAVRGGVVPFPKQEQPPPKAPAPPRGAPFERQASPGPDPYLAAENAAAPGLAHAFAASVFAARERTSLKDMALAIERGRPDQAVDWDAWGEDLSAAMEAAAGAVADAMGEHEGLAADTSDAWTFDAWVRRNVASEVSRTLKGGREAIREAVKAVLSRAITKAQAAEVIRGYIGLNGQQVRAVEARMAEMEAAGSSPEAIMEEAERLQGILLAKRAATIAQHETRTAAAEVHRRSMKRSGVKRKEWVAQPEGACPICEGLDGQAVPIDGLFEDEDGEQYDGPPGHVSCRCFLAGA